MGLSGRPTPDLLAVRFTAGASKCIDGLRPPPAREPSPSFGVPDGTPGKAQTTQVGLYGVTAWNSGSDYFPAEHINIFPTGANK